MLCITWISVASMLSSPMPCVVSYGMNRIIVFRTGKGKVRSMLELTWGLRGIATVVVTLNGRHRLTLNV